LSGEVEEMGTRINVLFDHDLSALLDQAATLARLLPTTLAALTVRDYWLAADPHSPHDDSTMWRADDVSPLEKDQRRRYTGPGSLFLALAPRTARLHTGGRWRGFLTIEPLRRVHLAAFRCIARAFGAVEMLLYPDTCEVDDLFYAGRTMWDCVEFLERTWGPPQRGVEKLDPRVIAEAEVFRVWYLESTGDN
jgi:hypothetical protein